MKRVVGVLVAGISVTLGCATAMDLGADADGDSGTPTSIRAGDGGDRRGDAAAARDGRAEAAVDAGTAAPEGSPCQVVDSPQSATCGKCGSKTRTCKLGADGQRVWGPWSACKGEDEDPDACDPSLTYPDDACGNCGKRARVCDTTCRFDTTAACIEPTFNGEAACAPGELDFSYGGPCNGANTGRKRTCKATCDWGDFGSCESLAPLAGPSLISANSSSVCVVVAGGAVKCWTTGGSPPALVPGITGATAISLGGGFGCALIANDSVKCWGTNARGALGNGTMVDSPTPVDVIGLSGVKAIAAGGSHVCALLGGGAIKCWGSGSEGQLGTGVYINGASAPSTPVTGITGATAVAAGAMHSCAVVGGSVKCWGNNSYGELGNGTNIGSNVPVAALGITTAIQVAGHTTMRESCAIIAGGAVKCWGEDEFGLGGGTYVSQGITTPTTVQALSGASAVALGRGFTTSSSACAVVAGTVECWGSNLVGQLGVPQPIGSGASGPVQVQNLLGAVSISAGGGFHCAQLASGTVKCWGDNSKGMLGSGVVGGQSSSPVTVVGVP